MSLSVDTTQKIKSISAKLQETGYVILLQTTTDSKGAIHSATLGIGGGYRGKIIQINPEGSNGISQTQPKQGVSAFRIFYRRTLITSSSSAKIGDMPDIFVVYGNIEYGYPVSLGAIPAPEYMQPLTE